MAGPQKPAAVEATVPGLMNEQQNQVQKTGAASKAGKEVTMGGGFTRTYLKALGAQGVYTAIVFCLVFSINSHLMKGERDEVTITLKNSTFNNCLDVYTEGLLSITASSHAAFPDSAPGSSGTGPGPTSSHLLFPTIAPETGATGAPGNPGDIGPRSAPASNGTGLSSEPRAFNPQEVEVLLTEYRRCVNAEAEYGLILPNTYLTKTPLGLSSKEARMNICSVDMGALFIFVDTLPKQQNVLLPRHLGLLALLLTTLGHTFLVAAATVVGFFAVAPRHAAVTPLSMLMFIYSLHAANVNGFEGYCLRALQWLLASVIFYGAEIGFVSINASWSQFVVYLFTTINMAASVSGKAAQAVSNSSNTDDRVWILLYSGKATIFRLLCPICKEGPKTVAAAATEKPNEDPSAGAPGSPPNRGADQGVVTSGSHGSPSKDNMRKRKSPKRTRRRVHLMRMSDE